MTEELNQLKDQLTGKVKELYFNGEKLQCKKLALDVVSRNGPMTADVLLREAKLIYDWLTEDLK